jgi:hypothetical protein
MGENDKKYKYKDFGFHLEKEIKNQYSDIKNFCKSAHIPYQTLNTYLIGRSFPPIKTFIKICKTLEKTPSYMLKPFLEIQKPEERDLLDFFDIFQTTYRSKTYKELAKVMILGLNILQLGKEIHGSEDPVENLLKFREVVMARLK